MSPKNSGRYLIQNLIYPNIYLISDGSKPTNQLADIQEIQNHLQLMHEHPRNAFKRYEKYISSRTKDIKQFS